MGEIKDAFGRIRGETPIDPSKLKKSARWIKVRSQLHDAEAKAIGVVADKYLIGRSKATSRAAFDLRWSCKLHREMFGSIWTWAGRTRQIELEGVGSKWFNVEPELHSLLMDLATWAKTEMDSLEQAATLHHRAVRIHPFENGNGRWARLMANILLKRKGRNIINWPDKRLVGRASPIREAYIRALQAADAGRMDELIELHRAHLQQ